MWGGAVYEKVYYSYVVSLMHQNLPAGNSPIRLPSVGGTSLGSSSKVSYFLDGTPAYLGMWFCTRYFDIDLPNYGMVRLPPLTGDHGHCGCRRQR